MCLPAALAARHPLQQQRGPSLTYTHTYTDIHRHGDTHRQGDTQREKGRTNRGGGRAGQEASQERGHLLSSFFVSLRGTGDLTQEAPMTTATATGDAAPSVAIRSLAPEAISLTLANMDLSLANALRRCLLAEVPTIAIDLVDFENNTVRRSPCFQSIPLGLHSKGNSLC